MQGLLRADWVRSAFPKHTGWEGWGLGASVVGENLDSSRYILMATSVASSLLLASPRPLALFPSPSGRGWGGGGEPAIGGLKKPTPLSSHLPEFACWPSRMS